MSNGGSDKASNNDSRSKGFGSEMEINKGNTNSIRVAEENLAQLFINNEEDGGFKRENTSSYQGTIIKRKKVSLIKDNTDNGMSK